MNSSSLSARSFGSRLALLMMFSGASCLAQGSVTGLDAASALELAKKMQQEAATAEPQATLGGNLKEFSITTGQVGSQASGLAEQSRVRAAAAIYREALKTDPTNAELHFDLSLALEKLGEAPVAQEELESAVRLHPNWAKLGRGEEAVGILQKVTRLQPNSAPAHLNLGIALAGDGFDLPGALEQFSEAIRLDPASAAAHYNKGRVLFDLSRRDEARTDLEAARGLQPDYPDVLYLLALAERQLGNIQRSAEVLDHLVTLEPGNSQAQHLFGQNLLLLGKTAEAIHHLQIAVGADPNDEADLYSLAQALRSAGQPEAKVFLERFRSLKQQREINDRIQNLGSYGLELANAKDWPQAVRNFQEAIEMCGQCASSVDLHRNLGLIYILKGDLEEGKRELETVLRIKPNDRDARKALQSLPSKEPKPD